MNENYQADPFTIIKLCQHNEAIIFNNLVSVEIYVNINESWLSTFFVQEFAQRLKHSVDKGFDEVYSLIDLCSGEWHNI